MADEHPSAQDEQSIIDNEINRTRCAERIRQTHEIVDFSDDRIRDSRHRLRICFDDVISPGKIKSR